jgi:hypothetical protein
MDCRNNRGEFFFFEILHFVYRDDNARTTVPGRFANSNEKVDKVFGQDAEISTTKERITRDRE